MTSSWFEWAAFRLRRWLRRLTWPAPVIYIHSSFVTPATLANWRAIEIWLAQETWRNYLDRAIQEARRPSPLFNPKFGFVGTGADALIQVCEPVPGPVPCASLDTTPEP